MTGGDFALEPGERILWQACPAPRAFVFRRWRLSLVCLPLWIWVSWRWFGAGLAAPGFWWHGLLWLVSGWGAVGHLLVARLTWSGRQYLATDRRVVIRRGWSSRRFRCLPLTDVAAVRAISLSGRLKTVVLRSRVGGGRLVLYCLEDAAALFSVLGNRGNALTAGLALE